MKILLFLLAGVLPFMAGAQDKAAKISIGEQGQLNSIAYKFKQSDCNAAVKEKYRKKEGSWPRRLYLALFQFKTYKNDFKDSLKKEAGCPLIDVKNVVDTTDLQKWHSKNMNQLREMLASSLTATIGDLSGNSRKTDIAFLYWLYRAHGDFTVDPGQIAGELQILRDKLKGTASYRPEAANVLVLKGIQIMDSLLAVILNKPSYQIDGTSTIPDIPRPELDLSIIENNAVKTFFVQFNNALLKDVSNNSILSMKANNLYAITEEIENAGSVILNGFAQAKKPVSIQNTQNVWQIISDFNNSYINWAGVTLLTHASWFDAWIWKKKGKYSLNPFDVTSDSWIAQNPAYDPAKADRMDEYVDSAVARMIRYDTTGNVDKFIKLLKYRGAGKTEFGFQQKMDSLKKQSDSIIKDISATGVMVNQIRFPVERSSAGSYIYLSGDGRYSLLSKVHSWDIKPIDVNERVTVTIYNIQQGGASILTLKKSDSIKDKGVLQDQLDQALSSASGLVTGLSTLTNAVSSFGKTFSVTTAPSPKITGDGSIVPPRQAHFEPPVAITARAATFWNGLKASLTGSQADLIRGLDPAETFTDATPYSSVAYDNSIFDNIKNAYTDTVNALCLNNPGGLPALKNVLTELYTNLLIKNHMLPVMVDSLKHDSAYVEMLLNTFGKSSLPSGTLNITKPTTPVLHTEFQSTDPTITPKSVIYEVSIKGAKDTSSLSRISYKTGNHYRILASAGVIYTCNSVIQNNVTTNGQHLTITSSEQRFQAYAGLHFYLFGKGLFMQDPYFFGSRRYGVWNRISLFTAVSIPQPLNNIYLGFSYDLGPGFRISTGLDLYKYTKYNLVNGQLVDQSNIYKAAAPFISIGIDPVTLVNAVNIFK